MDISGSVAFFDLGDTLASVSVAPNGRRIDELIVFEEAWPVLRGLRAEGVRLGLLSNPGPIPAAEVRRALGAAGLAELLDAELVVLGRKDSPRLFRKAARLAGDPKGERCAFIGEDAAERAQALRAGMRVASHVRLARAALSGASAMGYLRLTRRPVGAGRMDAVRWQELLEDLPAVALDADPGPPPALYVVAPLVAASAMERRGFWVDRLGRAGLADSTDLYLLRDDSGDGTGADASEPDGRPPGGAGLTDTDRAHPPILSADELVLASGRRGFLVAVPPGVEVEDLHLPGGQHGHNLKLTPLTGTGFAGAPRAEPGAAAELARAMAPTLAPDALSLAEQAVFAKAITATSVSEVVGRYTGNSTTGLATRIRSRHILHPDNAAAVTALAHDLAAFGPLRVRLHRFTHQGRSYQNVEAVLPDRGAPPGRPGAVIISAHVDSTGARQPGYRAATDAAPGADDDASGVAGVLVAAQAVCLLAESAAATPRRPIRFLLFNAEEHGLVGSRAYARDQSALGAPIAAVFQLDMVGWDAIAGRSWELHAGFGPSPAIQTASAALANVVSGAAGLVSRTLPTPQIFAGQEADPAEARSDHYSFQVVGYPACLASEDFFVGPGPATTSDGNPNYHMPGDTAIKAEYTADIVRAVAAAAWLTATR